MTSSSSRIHTFRDPLPERSFLAGRLIWWLSSIAAAQSNGESSAKVVIRRQGGSKIYT
jgi:hypothetical protein